MAKVCVLALLLVFTGKASLQKVEMTEASKDGEYDIHVECPSNCMEKVRIEAKGH